MTDVGDLCKFDVVYVSYCFFFFLFSKTTPRHRDCRARQGAFFGAVEASTWFSWIFDVDIVVIKASL